MELCEVAELCGVPPGVVNRWIRFGIRLDGYCLRLAATTVEDRVRVTSEALDTFRKQCARAKIGKPLDVPAGDMTPGQRREQRVREHVAAMLRNYQRPGVKAERAKIRAQGAKKQNAPGPM
ncbi:hypothetical protein [Limnoglobus roseus]|uniref:Uncharacterized protein n=1 Tax=Limnoglobus roseus TaxID=2598579 RepID=A0A5C1AI74_9BACT|nr:hypothetical protein [Limnoglobus roseus]QEL18881.1 hypothetical protein PX52LOC_05924 [Limnoglobus roseus]